jgi:hypothetical protein
MNNVPAVKSRESTPATVERTKSYLVCLVAVLLVGSFLLLSSQEYRAGNLLVASLFAAYFGKALLAPLRPSIDWRVILVGIGLLVAHGASWLGGLLHGENGLMAGSRALMSLLSVSGLMVFIVLLLEPRWKNLAKWTGLVILMLLLLCSFAGYFFGLENVGVSASDASKLEAHRMALIWPTRLIATPLGQIPWEHTNFAAFHFALALIMILEHLARGARSRAWWCLCLLLVTAVFLTYSRNGLLMILAALPLVLVGRKPIFAMKTLALLAVGILLGVASLNVKIAQDAATAQQASARLDSHAVALLERRTGGRFYIYQQVWREVRDAPLCGQGLWSVGRQVESHSHEHSVFIATLRGGGLIGLAGHLLVLTGAACASAALMRRGVRWPAVLLVTTVFGMLFERSSVIALTGNHEFITHWVAVLIPLIMTAKSSLAKSD